MKDALKMFVAVVAGLVLIIGVLFATGTVGNVFNATVGRQAMDVQRENFQHSKSYVDGKVQDLAKYKREYERASTKDEKAQVRNYVLNEFANFDKTQIDNPDLYNFLLQLERGTN